MRQLTPQMKLHQNTLEIMTATPFEVMTKIRNAGAIFIGEYSKRTVWEIILQDQITSFLQTELQNFSLLLSVDDFIKKSSIISYSREALEKDSLGY